MPFLMTGLNLVSAYIFAANQTKRGRYQLYGMAGLFLILLYNSPSGLLLYWSCNNLISLFKNLVSRYHLFRRISGLPDSAGRLCKKIALPFIVLLLLGATVFGSVALYYLFKSSFTVLLIKIAYFPMLYLTLLAVLFFLKNYRDHFFSQIFLLLLLALIGQAGFNILWGPFSMDLRDLIMNLVSISLVSVFLPLLEYFNNQINLRHSIDTYQFKKGLYQSILILVVLAGLVIPTSLVSSSPMEMGILQFYAVTDFYMGSLLSGLCPSVSCLYSTPITSKTFPFHSDDFDSYFSYQLSYISWELRCNFRIASV